jgi:hypothetical protein
LAGVKLHEEEPFLKLFFKLLDSLVAILAFLWKWLPDTLHPEVERLEQFVRKIVKMANTLSTN